MHFDYFLILYPYFPKKYWWALTIEYKSFRVMIFEMTAAKRGGTVFFFYLIFWIFLFLSKILAEMHSYLLGVIELESVSGACEEGTHLLEPYAGAAVLYLVLQK